MNYNMNFNMNNGTSEVLSMAIDFINQNHVIINDLVNTILDKTERQYQRRKSSNSSLNQEFESYSSDELLSKWST